MHTTSYCIIPSHNKSCSSQHRGNVIDCPLRPQTSLVGSGGNGIEGGEGLRFGVCFDFTAGELAVVMCSIVLQVGSGRRHLYTLIAVALVCLVQEITCVVDASAKSTDPILYCHLLPNAVVLSGAAEEIHKVTYMFVTAFSNLCGGPDGSTTVYIYIYIYG